MTESEKKLKLKWEETTMEMNKLRKLIREDWAKRRDNEKKNKKNSKNKDKLEQVNCMERHLAMLELLDNILDDWDELETMVDEEVEAAKRSNQAGEEGKDNQANKVARFSANKDEHYKLTKVNKDGKTVFKCCKCKLTSSKVSHVKRHIEAVHEQVAKYACKQCDYKGCTVHYLRKHIKKHHPDVCIYKCEECRFAGKTRKDLNVHRAVHYIEEPTGADHTDALTTHTHKNFSFTRQRLNGKLSYQCSTCPFKTIKISDVKRHIEAKHVREPNYACDKCSFKATFISYLKDHKKRQHPNPPSNPTHKDSPPVETSAQPQGPSQPNHVDLVAIPVPMPTSMDVLHNTQVDASAPMLLADDDHWRLGEHTVPLYSWNSCI